MTLNDPFNAVLTAASISRIMKNCDMLEHEDNSDLKGTSFYMESEAKIADFLPLKMASQEMIPSFYECSPLLGVVCV
jgi:hypothetical protein